MSSSSNDALLTEWTDGEVVGSKESKPTGCMYNLPIKQLLHVAYVELWKCFILSYLKKVYT
jgi:hypothetical protein